MRNGTRTIQFPEDRAVGYIHMSDGDACIPFFHGRFTREGELVGDTPVAGWRFLGEARSQVEVPTSGVILLEVLPEAARDLSWLAALGANDLTAIWLGNTHVNDEQLQHLAHLTGLRWVNTENNGDVTDTGIAHLAALQSIESLGIHWTRITGDTLRLLSKMPHLAFLDIWGCAGVDAASIDALENALPGCEVRTEPG